MPLGRAVGIAEVIAVVTFQSGRFENAYVEAWRLGLKAIAIYRDGCKRTQPLSTGASTEEATDKETAVGSAAEVRRRKLPDTRDSVTHKFSVAGHEGYIHIGQYEDGTPGELFIKIAKEGSTVAGLMDTVGIVTSMALQYGVPLDVLVSKFSHVRFEPSGFTKNPEIPVAKSLIDYIFRFLGARFLSPDQRAAVGLGLPDRSGESAQSSSTGGDAEGGAGNASASGLGFSPQSDAPSCADWASRLRSARPAPA